MGSNTVISSLMESSTAGVSRVAGVQDQGRAEVLYEKGIEGKREERTVNQLICYS